MRKPSTYLETPVSVVYGCHYLGNSAFLWRSYIRAGKAHQVCSINCCKVSWITLTTIGQNIGLFLIFCANIEILQGLSQVTGVSGSAQGDHGVSRRLLEFHTATDILQA